ncbi:MAG: xanthine dehydrogenase family protein subunit M [Pseudomonadota bacterium]
MQYAAPQTVEAAIDLLTSHEGAHVLAGGTDLLVQLRSDRVAPEVIVDIKRIDGMKSIRDDSGGFRIGAAVSAAEITEHAGLGAAWPGLVEAAGLIGSTQVQGRATIVGNLCNASPAADTTPALIAAGARIVISGPTGTREIPAEEMTTGPGRTTLAKGELVEAVRLPTRAARSGDAYLRFIPRTEMDIAVVGAGVSLSFDDAGMCQAARVALGAVAPKAVLVADAAAALIGTAIDDAALEQLAQACAAACNPIDDKRGTIEFRTQVAGVLAKRAAVAAKERAFAAQK